MNHQFQDFDEALLEMLNGLLTFNPQKRVSMQECLNFKIFDEIRCKTLELKAKRKIVLELDQSGSFDYDTGEDKLFKNK
jgi:hypothetical protein